MLVWSQGGCRQQQASLTCRHSCEDCAVGQRLPRANPCCALLLVTTPPTHFALLPCRHTTPLLVLL